MANTEIYQQRDELNKKLVEALSMYGNLEPPGYIGRPYNEGAKSKYAFTATNYLRLLVAEREHNATDPRWISASTVERKGYTLKDGAKPVGIEYWKTLPDNRYEGEVREFYNAADIAQYDDRPLNYTGSDNDNDFGYAMDLLRDSGIKVPGNATAEQIFDITKEHAKKNGANEFSSALAGQLMLKTCHLTYDFTKKPLFTQEQIEKLEQNPKIIFRAMKSAQAVINKLEYNMQRKMDESMKRIQQEIDLRKLNAAEGREPFRNLKVDYAWSEGMPLKDMNGNDYKENITLTGEDAYKFLVQLNASDKQHFNDRRPKGDFTYDKAKLSISYGRYEHGEMRIDLGDLELGNKDSITEALTKRLSEFRDRILDDAPTRRMILDNHKDEGLTEAQLIADCQEENRIFREEMELFAQEEKRYLAVHPEIQKINQEHANAFLYTCSQKDLDLIPQNRILNLQAAEPDMVVNMKKGAEKPKEALASMPPDNIVFEANFPIDSETAKNLPIHAVVTGEERRAMQGLDKLSVKIIDHGSLMGEPKEEIIEHKGVDAIASFIREKKQDADKSRDIYDMKLVNRADMTQKEMVLSFDGKEFARVTYEIGSGKLNHAFPSGFPPNSDKEQDAEIQRGVYAALRMSGVMENAYLQELGNQEDIYLPKLDTLQMEVLKEKPPARALNSKQYEYYKELAAQDLSLESREDIQKAMLQHMRKDNLADIKIANIVKTNPEFDAKLLPQKKKPSQKAKEQPTAKEKVHQKVAEQKETYSRKR